MTDQDPQYQPTQEHNDLAEGTAQPPMPNQGLANPIQPQMLNQAPENFVPHTGLLTFKHRLSWTVYRQCSVSRRMGNCLPNLLGTSLDLLYYCDSPTWYWKDNHQ